MITYLDFLKEEAFESAHAIGDPVYLIDGQNRLEAHVRVVLFTSGKVRYSIFLDGSGTTIHNVDSYLIEPNPNGTKIDLPFDNYS